MNLLERETVEYTLSPDELMLKELERRDGIYSFIFHELETTSKEGGGSSYLLEKTNGNLTNGFNHNQFIIYKVDDSDAGGTMTSATDIKSEDCAVAPPMVSMPSPLINTEILASSPSYTDNFGGGVMKKSSADFWKTWHPPFATSSCRFLDQPRLYNYVSSGSFQIRIATPRFSHVSVPLVRNRRHALKDTPEYKSLSTAITGHVPDLRSLFPYDPDVLALFTEVSPVVEAQHVVKET